MIRRPFVYAGYSLEGDMLTNQFEDLYPARNRLPMGQQRNA